MNTQASKRWGAAAGALVVAAGSAVIWAPGAGASAQHNGFDIVRTCKGTNDGNNVKLRATLHRTSSDNDVTSVDLRATDQDETGGFRNADVDLRRLVIRVKDESKTLVRSAHSSSSPYTAVLGTAGQEVGKIHTEARFRSGGQKTVVECNFTFSEGTGGSSNG